MKSSLVVLDRSEIREGRQDEVGARFRELADFVAAHEPRVIAYSVFFSEDRRAVTVLQVHPDSESMEFHMQAAAHLFAPFIELLQMESIDVYGEPSRRLLEALRAKSKMLGARRLTVHDPAAGFGRFGEG